MPFTELKVFTIPMFQFLKDYLKKKFCIFYLGKFQTKKNF